MVNDLIWASAEVAAFSENEDFLNQTIILDDSTLGVLQLNPRHHHAILRHYV